MQSFVSGWKLKLVIGLNLLLIYSLLMVNLVLIAIEEGIIERDAVVKNIFNIFTGLLVFYGIAIIGAYVSTYLYTISAMKKNVAKSVYK